jgi:hypothetical protein
MQTATLQLTAVFFTNSLGGRQTLRLIIKLNFSSNTFKGQILTKTRKLKINKIAIFRRQRNLTCFTVKTLTRKAGIS